MTYDYSALSGRIVEKCVTRKEFSRMMGISTHTISLKLNNKVQWTQNEIVKACKILQIEISDISYYFFTLNVQKN